MRSSVTAQGSGYVPGMSESTNYLVAEYVYVVDLKVQFFARDPEHAQELANNALEGARVALGDEQLFSAEIRDVRRRDKRDVPAA